MRPRSISDFRGEVKTSGEQLNFKCCPMCGSDSYKVYLSPQTGMWFCHAGAHQGGGKVQIGEEPATSNELLALLNPAPQYAESEEVELPAWRPLGEESLAYLLERNINPQWAKKLGIVEMVSEPRVIIPYFDDRGNLIYWQARAIRDGMGAKYTNCPGVSRPLYQLPAKKSRGKRVLVEGVFDAIAVHLWAGLNPMRNMPVAAIGGKTLPQRLVQPLLDSTPGTVILFLDDDALGSCFKIRDQLLSRRNVMLQVPPRGKDPADMSLEQLRRLSWG